MFVSGLQGDGWVLKITKIYVMYILDSPLFRNRLRQSPILRQWWSRLLPMFSWPISQAGSDRFLTQFFISTGRTVYVEGGIIPALCLWEPPNHFVFWFKCQPCWVHLESLSLQLAAKAGSPGQADLLPGLPCFKMGYLHPITAINISRTYKLFSDGKLALPSVIVQKTKEAFSRGYPVIAVKLLIP